MKGKLQNKDKIKFLIVKMESIPDGKFYNEANIVSSFNELPLPMTQSKMAMSSATT